MSTNNPNSGQWGDPSSQQPAPGQWGNQGGYQQPAYQQTGPVPPGAWQNTGGYGAPAPAAPQGSGFTWPLTIRESALGGLAVLLLIFSFFSLASGFGAPYLPMWGVLVLWVFPVALPVIASALIVIRAFTPKVNRVGSLSVDQFASVVYSFAFAVLIVLLLTLAQLVAAMAGAFGVGGMGGGVDLPWVLWIYIILLLAGLVLTVGAPHIPGLREDFQGRAEEPAHRVARKTRYAAPRAPRAPRAPQNPYGAHQTGGYPAGGFGQPQHTGGYDPQSHAPQQPQHTGGYDPQFFAQQPQGAPEQGPGASEQRSSSSSGDAPAFEFASEESIEVVDTPAGEIVEEDVAAVEVEQPAATPVPQPFWALAPVERDVFEEQSGEVLFRIGPSAWALVVEDRGTSYLVRHDDGRVGVLYDVTGITRG